MGLLRFNRHIMNNNGPVIMGAFKITLIFAVLVAVACALERADFSSAAHELATADDETSGLEIFPADLTADNYFHFLHKYKYKKKKRKGGYRSHGYGGYGRSGGYGRGGGYGRSGGYYGRSGGYGKGGGGSSEESGRY